MVAYRGIEITCETIGSIAGGSSPTPIVTCRAEIDGRPIKGSLEQVKQQIDEELERKDH